MVSSKLTSPVLLVVVVALLSVVLTLPTTAFTPQQRSSSSIISSHGHAGMMESMHQRPGISSVLFLSDNNNNSEDRLRQLGYSEDEIRRSNGKVDRDDDIKVRVDLIDDVDPVSLTAIGFALIALNFLVFANLGDGGISGVVARLINSF